MSPPDLVLTGRFEPAEERRFRHLPFAVPPGLDQLHLRYDSSDRIPSDPTLRGGNTLDLGLFDGRGTEPGGAGFRGWSGSARRELAITAAWATPPYRPGPIAAGEWHVLLGAYKVGPRGLDYRIEIRFDPDLPPEPPLPPLPIPPPVRLPPPAEPGWVRADLHCHTRRSDGDATPLEVRRLAAAAGLDVVAFTDHNSPSDPRDRGDPGDGLPLVVPALEVTTYGGHWNAWGVDAWFDFRDPTPAGARAAMAAAISAGAVVSVNHPKPFGPDWAYGDDLQPDLIEVWNGPWERLNGRALAR